MPRKRHESEKTTSRLDRRSEGKAILTERGFKQKGCRKKDAKTKVSKKKNVPREWGEKETSREEGQKVPGCQKMPKDRTAKRKIRQRKAVFYKTSEFFDSAMTSE